MQKNTAAFSYGACPVVQDGQPGWLFRLYAPSALSVSVVGAFNQWDIRRTPMTKKSGIWTAFVSGLQEYDTYKFAIRTRSGDILFKADPYAFHGETPPGNCSKLYAVTGYCWRDQIWFDFRAAHPLSSSPFHVYEIHAGSWRHDGNGVPLSYRTAATYLVPHVKEMGYTGIMIRPMLEYQTEGQCERPDSWFAPTSRFGTPKDFMYLVDELHAAGISVLMEFPCGGFPVNEHGLASFDGSEVYEKSKASGADDLCSFDLSRAPVRRFLLDSAIFWLEQYHLDGLRLIGLPKPGRAGVRDFLKTLSLRAQTVAPGSVIITDQPTAASTMDLAEEWMDRAVEMVSTLERQTDVPARLLPVPPKSSLLALDYPLVARLGGSLTAALASDREVRLSRERLLHLLMLAFPGKKQSFMSNELGQERGWDYHYSLDWHLMHYEAYRKQNAFFRSANQLYLTHPALWMWDDEAEGFQLVEQSGEGCDDVLAFRRIGGNDRLLMLFNFSGHGRHLRLGVEEKGWFRVLLNTDDGAFGGRGQGSYGRWQSETTPADGLPCSLGVELPPAGGVVLAYDGPVDAVPVLITPVD